jgi:hypothetical protein
MEDMTLGVPLGKFRIVGKDHRGEVWPAGDLDSIDVAKQIAAMNSRNNVFIQFHIFDDHGICVWKTNGNGHL